MIFDRKPADPAVFVGQEVTLIFRLEGRDPAGTYIFQVVDPAGQLTPINKNTGGYSAPNLNPGDTVEVQVIFPDPGNYEVQFEPPPPPPGAAARAALGRLPAFQPLETITAIHPPVSQVALISAGAASSQQQDLWDFIDQVTKDLRFRNFAEYLATTELSKRNSELRDPMSYGSVTYKRLHELSSEFVTRVSLGGQPNNPRLVNSGLTKSAVELSYVSDEDNDLGSVFPYTRKKGSFPLGRVPFVELIFSYWIEEAMVFQTLNHIIARFQNRRVAGGREALSRFSVNPLMPLRGILWGLAEAEGDRLTVRRRDAEYEYQLGLRLIGRAIPPAEMLVERRTQFLGAFHGLLNASYRYYKERDDKTIDADPFPLLSSLRELHLVLAMGAHNQFADLPLTARIEIMDVKWMLSQPEMREFLGGPTMIPYEEPWMDRVDTMKTLQGWGDASVTHFYDLAYHGEKLLLSVRHGRWSESGRDRHDADNWAVRWRNSVQRYIHAYRAVTGVDLSQRVDTTMPSKLLARRLTDTITRI